MKKDINAYFKDAAVDNKKLVNNLNSVSKKSLATRLRAMSFAFQLDKQSNQDLKKVKITEEGQSNMLKRQITNIQKFKNMDGDSDFSSVKNGNQPDDLIKQKFMGYQQNLNLNYNSVGSSSARQRIDSVTAGRAFRFQSIWSNKLSTRKRIELTNNYEKQLAFQAIQMAYGESLPIVFNS